MLVIVLDEGSNRPEIDWHMDEQLPEIKLPRYVVEIQADGDELEYIQGRFTNIPMTHGRVVSWKGEFARFIWDNMR